MYIDITVYREEEWDWSLKSRLILPANRSFNSTGPQIRNIKVLHKLYSEILLNKGEFSENS